MDLKEKFGKAVMIEMTEPTTQKWVTNGDNQKARVEQCEKIADDFAIGFTEWCSFNSWFLKEMDLWENKNYKNSGKKTTQELLEIYKKEKGL